MKSDSKISLLIEGYPRRGYQIYSKIAGGSMGGLCFSRLHPAYVASKYGMDRAKCYWLTGQKADEAIPPRSLHMLIKTLRTELRGRSGGTVFMDGLEYLLLFNDLNKTMAVLGEMDQLLKQANVELIVAVDPLTFEAKDIERLWAEFPRYTIEELMEKYSMKLPQNIASTAPESARPAIEGL